jgi:hypothetical protein
VGRARYRVKARAAGPAEHERLWGKLVASYRYYDDYRQRTAREIPVVVLERA